MPASPICGARNATSSHRAWVLPGNPKEANSLSYCRRRISYAPALVMGGPSSRTVNYLVRTVALIRSHADHTTPRRQ
jgi:hypothetical protein